ncbi:MAG TPA: ribosome biogenesis factor YjgA [Steroidobacteraceae bacterium]
MTDAEDEDQDIPSKSARKRESDELQALGEALITLPMGEFDALPLPESLRDAVLLARRITAHGGLYRQKQYIGKLMRKIDSEPIRAALAARREEERTQARRFQRVEQWRDRIVNEGAPAIEQFITEVSARVSAASLHALLSEINSERERDLPPKAARELFRVLRDGLA